VGLPADRARPRAGELRAAPAAARAARPGVTVPAGQRYLLASMVIETT
jgi:hypothetical protein